jgi:tetratricopeptide (TPR) repeat protein
VNKSHFIDFVENPSKIREKDADILAELARNYPYSSLIHTLLAKARRDTPQAKSSLASAALHISDRNVLKGVMENNFSHAVNKEEEVSASDLTPATGTESRKANPLAAPHQQVEKTAAASLSSVKIEMAAPAPEKAEDKESVFDELQENLRKLQEQRNRFINSEEQSAPHSNNDQAPSSLPAMADAEEVNNEVKEVPAQHLPERLQEIVLNREVQEIKDPKRVEQINLIDSFIEKSSSIARKYRSMNGEETPQSDLTDSYQFTPQDLVTENLAKIMVRQGKSDKAIDIYEKLILKYPQKKTYFATCLEKLKNTQ